MISNPKPNDNLIFIFDSTRLRSHLFFRYLSTSPQLTPILHPYVSAAMFGPEHIAQHLHHSAARQRELDEDLPPLMGTDTYSTCTSAFRSAVSDAQAAGKTPLANEHWFNVLRLEVVLGLVRGEITTAEQLDANPTVLPTELYASLRPIILIRHPALAIRSIHRDALKMTQQRPGDEDFDFICVNRPLRVLFEHFSAQGRRPVVVDAEDILWRTEELARNVCASLGTVDAAGLSDTWEPAGEAEMAALNPLRVMLTRNILESSGIERPREKVSEVVMT